MVNTMTGSKAHSAPAICVIPANNRGNHSSRSAGRPGVATTHRPMKPDFPLSSDPMPAMRFNWHYDAEVALSDYFSANAVDYAPSDPQMRL